MSEHIVVTGRGACFKDQLGVRKGQGHLFCLGVTKNTQSDSLRGQAVRVHLCREINMAERLFYGDIDMNSNIKMIKFCAALH